MKGAGWQRRQRGRAKVWREDREMDGITGFRSRTAREKARDKEKKRERERERERAFRVERTHNARAKLKENQHAKLYFYKFQPRAVHNNPFGG